VRGLAFLLIAQERAMSANSPVSFLRTIVAVLRPLLALVLQWMFWPYIQPYVWFLFCLAVFLSSWIGGLSGGLAATVLSTALVLYLFVPPEVLAALGRPRNSLSVVVFMGMGVLFSLFHERLNRTAVAMHGFDGPDDYLRRLPEFTDTFELTTLDGTVFPLEQWPLARAARRDQGSG
jgi:hypothetical protein